MQIWGCISSFRHLSLYHLQLLRFCFKLHLSITVGLTTIQAFLLICSWRPCEPLLQAPHHPGPLFSPFLRPLVPLCRHSFQFRDSWSSSFSLRIAHRQSSLGPGTFLNYIGVLLTPLLARNQRRASPAPGTAATQTPRTHAPPLTSEIPRPPQLPVLNGLRLRTLPPHSRLRMRRPLKHDLASVQ